MLTCLAQNTWFPFSLNFANFSWPQCVSSQYQHYHHSAAQAKNPQFILDYFLSHTTSSPLSSLCWLYGQGCIPKLILLSIPAFPFLVPSSSSLDCLSAEAPSWFSCFHSHLLTMYCRPSKPTEFQKDRSNHGTFSNEFHHSE